MKTKLYRIHYDDNEHDCNSDALCLAADAKEALLIFLFNSPSCSPTRIEYIGEGDYGEVMRGIEREERQRRAK